MQEQGLNLQKVNLYIMYKWAPRTVFNMAHLKTVTISDIPFVMMEHMALLYEIQDKILIRKNKWAEEHCVAQADLPYLYKTRDDLLWMRRDLILFHAKRLCVRVVLWRDSYAFGAQLVADYP